MLHKEVTWASDRLRIGSQVLHENYKSSYDVKEKEPIKNDTVVFGSASIPMTFLNLLKMALDLIAISIFLRGTVLSSRFVHRTTNSIFILRV